ncbi:MAG: sulfur carrier protein ThiS [Treponema sp.]|jgi:thiamine biosynthesis protein ThiS|nr:sulfur carrier protein ThiS [Treponema sp.]
MVTVNGKLRDQGAEMTLAELLEAEGYKPDQVAVGLNGTVVPRGGYAQVLLGDNDEIEIFHFMGGGQWRKGR